VLPGGTVSTTVSPSNEDILVDMNDETTAANLSVINAVKRIQKVYPSFIPHKNLVEFLLFTNKEAGHLEEEGAVVTRNINVLPPFNIMALFYFKKTMYSHLFHGLCDRALPSKIEDAKFHGMQLATKHRFHVCHIGQEKNLETLQKSRSGMFGKERKKIHELIKNSFNHTTPEDNDAIENAFKYGQAFYIIGFGNNLGTHHVIAVVLYVMTEQGSYINWLAVTHKTFTCSLYGKHATEKQFRGMGLATFLLHMVQLQAASKDYSINLYLQSNISSQAYQWYAHRGFVLSAYNDAQQLPETIRSYYFQSQSTALTGPYVHFVTTDIWNQDVQRGGNDPFSEEWQNQRLLLIHLNTTLNLRDSSFDVDITTVKSDDLTVFYSVLPSNDLSTFLTFPFKECANQINQATDGLTVFDNPFFKVQDEGEKSYQGCNFRIFSYILRRKNYHLSLFWLTMPLTSI